jgi:hypothetical protein
MPARGPVLVLRVIQVPDTGGMGRIWVCGPKPVGGVFPHPKLRTADSTTEKLP